MRLKSSLNMKCKKPQHCECHKPPQKECNKPIYVECTKPQECFCGKWSEFKPLNPKDEEIFFIALKGFCGSDFIPLLVSTRVCEGYNFIFLAEKIVTGSCHPCSLVYIRVLLMHCGKIKLVSIDDAHLYPEVRNDCSHEHCCKPCKELPSCGSFYPEFY